jgi:hypothetical protein
MLTQDTLMENWINIYRISCTYSLLLSEQKKSQCKDRLLFENTSSNFSKHEDADY